MSGQEPRPLDEQPRFRIGPASRVYKIYAASEAHNSVKTNNALPLTQKIGVQRLKLAS